MNGSKGPAQHRSNGHRLTRRRVPLSCAACRIRKLKCNREKPCQNCVVRGDAASSCLYLEKPLSNRSASSNARLDAEDMRSRLNRLEASILTIISNEGDKVKQPGQPRPESNVDHVIKSSGHARGQSMSIDTRSTHWDAVLQDLGAIKDVWSEENDQEDLMNGFQLPYNPSHRPSLLTGFTEPPDQSTILASLPSKNAVDRLVTRFFESYNPLIPTRYIIHKSTFLQQYTRHWNDPTQTRIIWIGLLFSILCISMQSYILNHEEPPEYIGTSSTLRELYRIRTIQCLIIADVTKPADLMIETLLLHSLAEYSDERDGDMGTWLMSGTMIHLALQQGYHRDPSQHPNLSTFQGEMRRRVWITLNNYELLFSVQIGVPRTIRYAECDTKPPSNLYEEDLYVDMKELPPSRPLTEPTEVSYQITKSRIMRAYGCVIEHLHILEPHPHEEVMRLDVMLMESREMIPPHLQLRPLEEMRDDPPSLIMERFILQLFYHKAVCVLHRKYWKSSSGGEAVTTLHYSRRTCVVSSLALLEHQASLHRACQPGGPLVNMKWYNFSILNHDFLLAAIIICLDLNDNSRGKADPFLNCNDMGLKFNTVQHSKAIWAEIADKCKDAKRAQHILSGILDRILTRAQESNTNISAKLSTVQTPISSGLERGLDTWGSGPYFHDQFSQGIPLSFVPAPITIGNNTTRDIMFSSGGLLSSFESDHDAPESFDWDSWDQFITKAPYQDEDQGPGSNFSMTQGSTDTTLPISREPGSCNPYNNLDVSSLAQVCNDSPPFRPFTNRSARHRGEIDSNNT